MTAQPSPPTVSVVMPAYNAARWIRESIDSVLAQTFADLEAIIVDDASTDDTAKVVRSVGDPRVRLVENERNSGAAMSRNRGIESAAGEFIAFLDADDIALPIRLEKQLAFLRSHPEVALCGGWMQTFGRRNDIWPAHERHDDIKAELLYACGLLQSTVMCRREPFLRHGLRYDPSFSPNEDYELWTRCADLLRLANLPEVLVLYRAHDENISLIKRSRMIASNRVVRMGQLAKLGVVSSEAEAALHARLFEYGPTGPGTVAFDLDQVERWLIRLRDANRMNGYVPDSALRIVLYEFWRRCCLARPQGGIANSLRFLFSPTLTSTPFSWRLRDTIKAALGLPLYPILRR